MTSELIAFIQNAIKEQGWRYKVSAQDNGLTLELTLDDADYILESRAQESFRISVTIEDSKDKKVAVLSEELFALVASESGDFSLGEPIEIDESAGGIESDVVGADDSWKLFIAKRWLVSILKYKGYALKEPAKKSSRVTLTVVAFIVAFSILALAFSGVVNAMANGAIDGFEEIAVVDDDSSDEEIAGGFFR